MARQFAIGCALLAGADAAMLRHTSSNGEAMRPDLVAETLVKVEEEWRKEAALFTEDKGADAKAAPEAFGKSCATVISAVIQGSGGDRDVAKEYMQKVCSQKVLAGWQANRCQTLATSITDHFMLADNYANRQVLKPAKVCTGYWSVFVEAEKNREAEEAKERAEKEKVRAEEEKKAAAAAAEQKAKEEAAAKVEAERRAKEESKRLEEEKELKAKQEAADAKVRAAEAAARLAEKKAEAERMQKEAQKKLEEAAEAEKEHQARLAEHEKAQKSLKEREISLPKKAPKEVKKDAEGPPPLSPAAPENKPAPAAKPVVAVAKPTEKTPEKPKVEAAKDAKAPAKVTQKAAKK